MNISVYLGSSTTCKPEYNALAYELGRSLALCGHTLVYGGADVGTMKYLADGAQSEGGRVIGVFPEGFAGTVEVRKSGIKVMREGLDEMVMVADFAERKKVMEELGECSVVLPGSYGTLDELFTYACNRTIGKHSKQIYLINHNGYFEPVRAILANMASEGFLKPSAMGIITFCDTVAELPFLARK